MIKNLIYIAASLLALSYLFLKSIFRKIFRGYARESNKKIIFGTTPIINNKYWSQALKEINLETETLMKTYYSSINKREDYDKYFEDLIPAIFRKKYIEEIANLFFVWSYIIDNAKIFVKPFNGVVFNKYFWKLEYLLFSINNIKTVVLPYGSDAYMYSRIKEPSFHNSLLISYPDAAKDEKEITNRVFFWSKYADITFSGFMGIDGMPRWDIPIFSWLQINTSQWNKKSTYSSNNGVDGTVRIMHMPNHRGVKGTEFLLDAIRDLRDEGLLIELILLEKVQNDKIREVAQNVDIFAEQFVGIGYALSAIEAMSSGLPVLSNLDNDNITNMFRRYSFLNECPILSTTPETLKDNLRLLITNPGLRKELGELGRRYVEKYHSYKMTQYLFGNIFKKLDGEDVDLMNLFHPLKSEYVKKDYINTPLINNRYIAKDGT